jgi:ADP-ribosylglycohydrolase
MALLLHKQYPIRADASTKIHTSFIATAMVDAFGGPLEFHRRFSFPLVTTMVPNKNFGLPSGIWTDNTSTTLCLSHSLATYKPSSSVTKGGFDEEHQLDAYVH